MTSACRPGAASPGPSQILNDTSPETHDLLVGCHSQREGTVRGVICIDVELAATLCVPRTDENA
jgi:hypothetical protein